MPVLSPINKLGKLRFIQAHRLEGMYITEGQNTNKTALEYTTNHIYINP